MRRRRPTREIPDEALQAIESREIEIVGRLVEQKDVEARKQHSCQLSTRGLASRQRAERCVERHPQPHLRTDSAGVGVEIAAAQQQETVERGGVKF